MNKKEITIGILYFNRDDLPAIVFGTIIIITGFFGPKCCIGKTRDIADRSKN